MSLLTPTNHSSKTTDKTNIRTINYPSQKLANLVVDDSEISVFSDGIHITQQSGGWLPVYRSERSQFLPLKHISSFTWGFAPNTPLIVFFTIVFVVAGTIIGYLSQSCYYGCSPIGGLVIGAIIGFSIGMVIVSVASERFRRFEFIIECDGNKFAFYPESSSGQSQIIHIFETWRSLKYHELTLQTNPNINQPNNQNPPTQTGYPNAPKG